MNKLWIDGQPVSIGAYTSTSTQPTYYIPWNPPFCGFCRTSHYQGYPCFRNPNPVPAPESAGGEEQVSLIDERQLEVLDGFRNARDIARRHAQTKVDKATLMKIQAEALIAESRELVAELNEDTPYPNETGANIGPIPGAGGATR